MNAGGEMATKVDDILDAAEGFARTRGYNGFSFRDIAAAVGIKSASVHYHFPTKADLGAAIVSRYSDRFFDRLGDPANPKTSAGALLDSYVAAFRHALVRDRQMCLCGMFGAEIASLPEDIAAEVKRFFQRNIEWLEVVLSRLDADGSLAPFILAVLEGALIVARSLGRPKLFDEIVAGAIPIRR